MESSILDIGGKTYTYSPVLTKDDGNVIYSEQATQWGNYAWYVFENYETWHYPESWYTSDERLPAYIGYDYKKVVSKVGVVLYVDDYNVTHHHPLEASIEVSTTDNDIWKVVKTIKGMSWSYRTPVLYLFDHPVSARKFRINITDFSYKYSGTFHRVRFLDSQGYRLYLNQYGEAYGMCHNS